MSSSRFKAILTLSPFKVGCLVVLAAALLFHSFGANKPFLLASLDNRLTDAMFRWRGAMPTSGQVVIVDIDEKSLRQVGQWPWPRHTVARLIRQLGAAAPKAIGLDILFAEADRTSPKNSLAELQGFLPGILTPARIAELQGREGMDHDQTLGQALAETPAVLGYVFQTSDDGLKNSGDQPMPGAQIRLEPSHVRYAELALLQAYRAILNIEPVARAESEGFFNMVPDASGTVRKVPLFMALDGIAYPSLALEMLRIGQGAEAVTIQVAEQEQAGKRSLLGVILADRFIPTDEAGQVTVNFRGPAQTFPHLSAGEILAGRHREQLRGKYVLIGTSAAGLLDLRATPFAGVYPGVEVHATVIDNALQNDPFAYDYFSELGLTYTLIVLGGLGLTALLAYSTALVGGLGGLLLIAATLAGNYFLFFQNHQLVGVVYPLATIVMVFMVVTFFNYFYEGREKRFISKAFGRYVSPQVVAQLRANPEQLSLRGEQKELTVLFSDIRGFTTIAEGMDSAQLGRFMNEYLTAMSNIVMSHAGTVDKFIGDAVMAVWGAPLPDEAHARHAVQAAFAMLAKLEELRPQWQARGLPPIEIGVGINSGLMSVGNFGSEQRFDYTVMGDNVNLASRLEGSNKTYGTRIVIAEATREALGENYFCRCLDLVRVKGKNQPVKLYEPLCAGAPDPATRRAVEEFEAAAGLYRQRRFAEAEQIFSRLQAAQPAQLYQLYLSRLAHFRTSPPPEDWDGVFTFTSK